MNQNNNQKYPETTNPEIGQPVMRRLLRRLANFGEC